MNGWNKLETGYAKLMEHVWQLELDGKCMKLAGEVMKGK